MPLTVEHKAIAVVVVPILVTVLLGWSSPSATTLVPAGAALAIALVLVWLMESDRRFQGVQHIEYTALRYYSKGGIRLVTGPNNTIIRSVAPLPQAIISGDDVSKLYPWHDRFVEAFPQILAEAQRVLEMHDTLPRFHDLDSRYTPISGHDKTRDWKTFVFKFYTDFNPLARKLCPVTSALIESVPDMHAAMFSILDPGFHIPPHRGPSAASLRYHLGIVIPTDGDCSITVGNTVYRWRQGEGMLFDDTYVHSVRNDTSQRRIVLFCDILRPLPGWLHRFEDALCRSPFVRAYFERYNKAMEQVQPIDNS